MRFAPGEGHSVGDFRVTDEWLEYMAELWVGHGYLTYLPGNGTQYELVLTNVDEHWVLSVPNFGTCMWLTDHDRWDPHPQYVAEKLRTGMADAMAICNVLEKYGEALAKRRVP